MCYNKIILIFITINAGRYNLQIYIHTRISRYNKFILAVICNCWTTDKNKFIKSIDNKCISMLI